MLQNEANKGSNMLGLCINMSLLFNSLEMLIHANTEFYYRMINEINVALRVIPFISMRRQYSL